MEWYELRKLAGASSLSDVSNVVYSIIYLFIESRVTRDTYRVDARVGHVDEEDGECPQHPHRHAVLLSN